MTTYYSDYLFHFTGKIRAGDSIAEANERGFNNLINILKNGFKFNRCLVSNTKFQENLPDLFSNNIEASMICFTDIPLNQIQEHTNKYGNFGIGLTKEWALEKYAQPVIYIDGNNTAFCKLYKNLIDVLNQKCPCSQEIEGYFNLLPKMDMGIFYTVLPLLALTETIEHYDEKEWRIINTPEINGTQYLDFNQSDIRLIVVPKDYINKLYKEIKNIFKDKYSNSEISFAIIPSEDIIKLTGSKK